MILINKFSHARMFILLFYLLLFQNIFTLFMISHVIEIRHFLVTDTSENDALNREEFKAFLHPEEHPLMRDIVVLETMEDIDKNKVQKKILLLIVWCFFLRLCGCKGWVAHSECTGTAVQSCSSTKSFYSREISLSSGPCLIALIVDNFIWNLHSENDRKQMCIYIHKNVFNSLKKNGKQPVIYFGVLPC